MPAVRRPMGVVAWTFPYAAIRVEFLLPDRALVLERVDQKLDGMDGGCSVH